MNIFNIFLIFAQNIDCGYTLEPPQCGGSNETEAVLTSIHNLFFRAKIRKNVYPCTPQFFYIKVGCKGFFITRTCFRDEEIGCKQSFLYTPATLYLCIGGKLTKF